MRKTKVLALAAFAAASLSLAGCWAPGTGDAKKVSWQVTPETATGSQAATATGISASGTALSGTAAVTSQGFTAYVSEAAGTVNKRPASGGRARPVTAGTTTLAAGDSLTTGDDGAAAVTFSDGTTVRLAASTKITFAAIGADAADATLESGSIWARVLKPLGDGTLYTFRTSDLSAGVRGTAVFLTTGTGGSEVEVHDSYADASADSGAVIDLGSGSGTTERRLAPRRRLVVPRVFPAAGTGTLAHAGAAQSGATAPAVREEPLDKAGALSDEFKRTNTQKDLVLMSRLIKEREMPAAQRRKVEGELRASLPSDAREVLALVKERKLLAGTGTTGSGAASDASPDAMARKMVQDPATIMDRIERDLAIGQVRDRFNRDARREMAGGSSKRDERIVENRRALDEAIERIVDAGTKPEDLRRQLPDMLPRLPGEGPRPQDDGTLKGFLRELRPRDGKPAADAPKADVPQERPAPRKDPKPANPAAPQEPKPKAPALKNPPAPLPQQPKPKLPFPAQKPFSAEGTVSGEAEPR